MTTRHVSCLGDLTLNPLFRREWSSADEALQDCRPQREKLMQLYIQQMSQVERPVLAIDHTTWLRPHVPTLKERTYEHQPTALPHGIPVGIGQGYIPLLSLWKNKNKIQIFNCRYSEHLSVYFLTEWLKSGFLVKVLCSKRS
jgi:hypothetical protein